MKRIIGIFLIILILINTCATTAMASSASSESKNIEEANMLLKDLEDNSRDYYRQFSTFDEPVFVNIAKSYLDNKPQFYRTNAWSDILNEEYCGKLNDPVNTIELFLASNLDAQDRLKTKRFLSFGIFCEFKSLVRYAIQQAVETKKTGGYFDKELRRYELEHVRLFVKTF